MTRMSDQDRRPPGDSTPKHARFQAGSPLARGVHPDRTLVRILGSLPFAFVSFALCAGCVIPPSLSVDNQDAGVNSPPAILAVRSDQQELPEGENVIFDQGPTAGKLNVQLIDTDVADTLFVRVFVDYNLADP